MFMHDRDDLIPSATELGARDPAAAVALRWHRRRSPADLALKRVLDFSGSMALLIVLSPAFLFIALLIKLDDGGPVFFRQERHGLHGMIFRIFKCPASALLRQIG